MSLIYWKAFLLAIKVTDYELNVTVISRIEISLTMQDCLKIVFFYAFLDSIWIFADRL